VFKMQHSRAPAGSQSVASLGQGWAARQRRPLQRLPDRTCMPLKAAESIGGGTRSDQRQRASFVGRRRLVSTGDGLSQGASSKAPSICSIRSRYDQGQASATAIRANGRPRAHEVRCVQTATGTARHYGTSYRCGMQSRCNRAPIMHRPRHLIHAHLSLGGLAATATARHPQNRPRHVGTRWKRLRAALAPRPPGPGHGQQQHGHQQQQHDQHDGPKARAGLCQTPKLRRRWAPTSQNSPPPHRLNRAARSLARSLAIASATRESPPSQGLAAHLNR